jgi:shikimate dehydrogenase
VITGSTRLTAVLGWPVDHSRSPQMLNAAYAELGVDAVMVPIPVRPEDLATVIAGLRTGHFLGASVTIPHKITAAALCDDLSPAAKAIGAVNCLQFGDEADPSRLIGHNTDEGGFLDGLVEAGYEPKGKRAVILGAGGAARAVAYALRGGRAIEVVARRPEKVSWARAWPWTPEQLRDCLSRADLVVDCTSISLGADEVAQVEQIPLDALPPGAWVSTLIYHRPSILLERAAAAGYSTLDGKAMLVHQGARAFTTWMNVPAPIDAMRRALDTSLIGT